MPRPEKARWSVNRAQFAGRVTDNGEVDVAIPMRDRNELAGTLHVTMTEDRQLTVIWEAEPGVETPVDFRAWSTVRSES